MSSICRRLAPPDIDLLLTVHHMIVPSQGLNAVNHSQWSSFPLSPGPFSTHTPISSLSVDDTVPVYVSRDGTSMYVPYIHTSTCIQKCIHINVQASISTFMSPPIYTCASASLHLHILRVHTDIHNDIHGPMFKPVFLQTPSPHLPPISTSNTPPTLRHPTNQQNDQGSHHFPPPRNPFYLFICSHHEPASHRLYSTAYETNKHRSLYGIGTTSTKLYGTPTTRIIPGGDSWVEKKAAFGP